MRYFASVVLLLTSLTAGAAPFVITDPLPAGVTQCGVYLDTGSVVRIPVTASAPGSNICRVDLATVTTGSHTISLTSITTNDPVWGSLESARSAPFPFSRPGVPVPPSGLGLSP